MSCRTDGRGIALVAVLWLIALLTMLATVVVTVSVTQRRMTERYAEAIQADVILDGALRVALLHLIAPDRKGLGWPVDQAQPLTLLDETVSVKVQREAGRIDLNTADPDLLVAFFAANGWRETDARSMAGRIVNWRDSAGETSEADAQSREYQAAHLEYGPHHAPFESVDELKQVLGSDRIQPDLFDSFTVFTHASECLENAATPAVKRALTWADKRRLGGRRWSHETQERPPAIGSYAGVALSGEILRLTACNSTPGADRCRVAVVRLTGSAMKPFQVFEWRGMPPTATH